jgi:hypothetical protein|tara:strand:- start:1982 stop:2320 length:339 start_codon:yes stop_codon:yes gene_type:complete
MIKIITNNHDRPFLYRHEVPQVILNGDLDWTDENDNDGYFCYRGIWYHTGQFMRFCGTAWIESPDPTVSSTEVQSDKWDGYHGDSFFSGILIKLSDDCETYRIATYYQTSDN